MAKIRTGCRYWEGEWEVSEQELFAAIKAKDAAGVSRLLDRNPALVNGVNAHGDSAVLIATYSGAAEIVKLLIERGSELNLWESAATGQADRLRELVDAEPALVNTISRDGSYPLALASFFGHKEAVELLLAKGADVHAWGEPQVPYIPKNQALHAALAGRRWDVARVLIDHGANVNNADSATWTPLHHAAHGGDAAICRYLIDRGAHVNARGEQDMTPLKRALERGNAEAAAVIRAAGGVE